MVFWLREKGRREQLKWLFYLDVSYVTIVSFCLLDIGLQTGDPVSHFFFLDKYPMSHSYYLSLTRALVGNVRGCEIYFQALSITRFEFETFVLQTNYEYAH